MITGFPRFIGSAIPYPKLSPIKDVCSTTSSAESVCRNSSPSDVTGRITKRPESGERRNSSEISGGAREADSLILEVRGIAIRKASSTRSVHFWGSGRESLPNKISSGATPMALRNVSLCQGKPGQVDRVDKQRHCNGEKSFPINGLKARRAACTQLVQEMNNRKSVHASSRGFSKRPNTFV